VRHNVHKVALLKEGGIVDNFLSQFESTDVDCCIVAVMSHGTEGYFLTSNPERMQDSNANKVSIHHEFLPRFNNHFPALQNKPKIFFIQACRGQTHDKGMRRSRFQGFQPKINFLNYKFQAFSELFKTPRILKNRIQVVVRVVLVSAFAVDPQIHLHPKLTGTGAQHLKTS